MPYRGAQIINLNVRNAIAALLGSDGLLMRKRLEIKDLVWPFIAGNLRVMQADCDTFPALPATVNGRSMKNPFTVEDGN